MRIYKRNAFLGEFDLKDKVKYDDSVFALGGGNCIFMHQSKMDKIAAIRVKSFAFHSILRDLTEIYHTLRLLKD